MFLRIVRGMVEDFQAADWTMLIVLLVVGLSIAALDWNAKNPKVEA